jgi:hypothetical protein
MAGVTEKGTDPRHIKKVDSVGVLLGLHAERRNEGTWTWERVPGSQCCSTHSQLTSFDADPSIVGNRTPYCAWA